MTFEQILAILPSHLKMAVKSVRLSPALGFTYPARFENLLEAQRWVSSDIGKAARISGPAPNVTLATIIQHSEKVTPVVVGAIRDEFNRIKC